LVVAHADANANANTTTSTARNTAMRRCYRHEHGRVSVNERMRVCVCGSCAAARIGRGHVGDRRRVVDNQPVKHVIAALLLLALHAPTEDELTSGAATSKVVAHYAAGAVKVDSPPVAVHFTVPTLGAPEIAAYASPDRVLAGGASPITLVVDARRLSSPSVSL